MDDPFRRVLFVCLLIALPLYAGAASAQQPVVFADWAYDSPRVHNRIAAFIMEHGFGYETDFITADTVPGVQGMRRGEIDVTLEAWLENAPEVYIPPIEDGIFVDLGVNFLEAPQGWYVPTYVIEGDPRRGIEAMAPDLKSVFDLPGYWELFKDPEVPHKGRFYNGITGWVTSEYNLKKLEAYGLTETYENFYPGSQTAADASIARAYERGEPWLGYYWEPTWVMGKYDMTLLEEPEYSEQCWNEQTGDFACAFPFVDAKILATAEFVQRAPELATFLRNYETKLEHTNEVLAYMEAVGANADEAALWFLQEFEDVWTVWVDDDVADRVKTALDERR